MQTLQAVPRYILGFQKDLFTVVFYFSTRPGIYFDKLIPEFLIYFEENYVFWFSAFPIYSCFFVKEKEN